MEGGSQDFPANGASGDYFGCDVNISGYTAIIGSPLDDDMGFNSGNVYFFSDGMMEHGRIYRNSPNIEGEAGDFLDLGWSYPETLLSLEPMEMMRGAVISDLVICTTRLAGCGLKISR